MIGLDFPGYFFERLLNIFVISYFLHDLLTVSFNLTVSLKW